MFKVHPDNQVPFDARGRWDSERAAIMMLASSEPEEETREEESPLRDSVAEQKEEEMSGGDSASKIPETTVLPVASASKPFASVSEASTSEPSEPGDGLKDCGDSADEEGPLDELKDDAPRSSEEDDSGDYDVWSPAPAKEPEVSEPSRY